MQLCLSTNKTGAAHGHHKCIGTLLYNIAITYIYKTGCDLQVDSFLRQYNQRPMDAQSKYFLICVQRGLQEFRTVFGLAGNINIQLMRVPI